MNIWIITTGNSDVQLKNKTNWNNLYRSGRNQLLNYCNFQPAKQEEESRFTVPARVMGEIYGNQLNDENYQDLCFPLLDAFSQQLTGKNQPDKIIVILTNQEDAYPNPEKKCPYWKDTCTLQPIFEKYFENNFPRLQKNDIKYLELTPKSNDEGLDNWDKALNLVQQKLSDLKSNLLDNPLDNIYVSHQAGTPAISSAIQFVSLARFGKRVKFLVSNEYEPDKTKLIESSSYLRGIQLQEAKTLLTRFDYSGVESLLKPYWLDKPNPEEEKLRQLLKIAIQWNFANFDQFSQELVSQGLGEEAKERLKTWWWTGYEAAYLAVVRLEQGNTVEALFHSFRAAEGLICKWAEHEYKNHIVPKSNQDDSPQIKDSVLNELPNYINRLYQNLQHDLTKNRKIGLYSEALYQLLQTAKPECQNPNHLMSIIWGKARKSRNPLFHRLLGLQEQDVFNAWDTKNKDTWKKKILDCLNFVTNQSFTSLPKASLMYQVNQDLEKALIDYELKAIANDIT
ncbi:MAG: hypothetical protein ACFB2X_05615 [Rivularia sp. (in: cyanobacteria)]